MVTHVIKRNGRKVKFNSSKIEQALQKSFVRIEELDEKNLQFISKVASDIGNSSKEVLTVDEIRDMIEKKLMASSHKDVAKSYINYRYLKELANRKYDDLWKAIEEKLSAKNVQNQNANVDEHSFSGRIGEASGVVTKKYALDNLVSPMARANHENNEIYIHDLDHYAIGDHNCLSLPFDDLLKNGFVTRQADVRPANSINTAMQLVAVLFQLQSLNQFGGVAATHLDWTMVPYVRRSFYKHYRDGMKYLEQVDIPKRVDVEKLSIEDSSYKKYPEVYQFALEMTDKECHQAVEGMYHNLNTLQSRSGGQVPFTSVNYGTCTLPEGRMVTRNLLEVSIEGLGKLHKTSIFPCGIFQYMKGVNDKEGTPNYDLFRLALKSTAKRLYPNYANVDWSVNAGYDRNDPTQYVSTMGCRTYNGFDINGLGFKKDGRGNICPVTIILPTLAMEAVDQCVTQQDDDPVPYFMDILDKKIHEAKDMLIERFDWICSQDASAAPFMYQNNTMTGYMPKEGIRSALKHGTIVIGQLGLAECLQALIGCDHTTEKGMELAKKIEQLFKDRCAEFKKEWHYDGSGPSKEDIEKRMLSLAKKRLKRELTEEEIQVIKRFKKQNM